MFVMLVMPPAMCLGCPKVLLFVIAGGVGCLAVVFSGRIVLYPGSCWYGCSQLARVQDFAVPKAVKA